MGVTKSSCGVAAIAAAVAAFLCCASAANAAELTCYSDMDGNMLQDVQTWCDPVLGCLNITDEWYSAMRPINVLPFPRAKINTRFLLHTRANRAMDDQEVIIVAQNSTTVDVSTFDPTKPLKFIIHGFIDTGRTYWLKQLADVFLDAGDFNVFRVDWGGGSKPMYSQAAANTRVVGLEIGYLVNWFISDYGVNPADVHLIGHSLGSHISGYGGEQIKNLGRISGMDPAGPYYTSMPTIVRLDHQDAVYVDNIHTDADSIVMLGYGTGQPMGNIDFFPNSGHDQPGCTPASIAIDILTPDDTRGDDLHELACSHCRSIDLYKESVRTESCTFLGHQCYDYDSFEAGKCATCGNDNAGCAYMGFRAQEYVAKEKVNAMFYLDTDGDDPFCLEHYQVSLLTGHPDKAEDWLVGHLRATFYGSDGQVLDDVKISDEHMRIDAGTVNKFQFTNSMDLGYIMRVDLRWDYDDELLKPGTYCWQLFCNRNLYIQSFQVSPINYYPESDRLSHTQLFCNMDGSVFELKDGHSVSIAPSNECAPMPY